MPAIMPVQTHPVRVVDGEVEIQVD